MNFSVDWLIDRCVLRGSCFYFAAGTRHQSVKKAGVTLPASVDSGSDDMADDSIEQSVEQPSVVAASLVIAALIVVPLTVAFTVTVCAKLHRQGLYLMDTFSRFICIWKS